ncbi:MAG: hypothetical protein ABL883_12900 [Terricaulis sp.]
MAEAEAEAALMRHAVDRYFCSYEVDARDQYQAPPGVASFEQEIGLKDHVARTMPIFLTLRADDGAGLTTAMLPPGGRRLRGFKCVIVGVRNSDPYAEHAPAIAALALHFKIELKREDCYPYL